MLKRVPIAILSLAMAAGALAQATSSFTNTLLPEPAHLSVEAGQLRLTPAFTVASEQVGDARLRGAITRALIRLRKQTSMPIATEAASSKEGSLTISVARPGQAVQSLDEDESYTLTVTPTGAALKAETDVGAMHGLETLLQLVQTDGKSFFLPAVSIQDTPRFRWRGLMIDCSRHFEPIEAIKRQLDGMAAVKLNVFHWHLSDDQGFRMESKVFPKLTGLGSDGFFYTQEQAREIVQYARDRGIRVIPEFDMPGHAQSWFVGYPDLASGPGPFSISRRFGIFDPVMDPTRKSTYVFLDKFIGEMTTIFPDAYLHVGGDENNGVQWKNNPRIQEFMQRHNLKDTAALQVYFNQQLMPILKKHNRRMVGWDEILAPGLPTDAVIQSWRGSDSLANGAQHGYQGILSAGYYLDQMWTAEVHYLVDPLPSSSNLTPEERARILGGEACMWGEHLSPRSIDSRIWPRAAAVAERLWSPQDVNDVDDMYRRLWVESLRLESLGLTHLSAEDRGLRELAATTAIEPLRVLASVVEPVEFNQRFKLQHTTQLTPLDRFIDVVPPDPPSRHGMQVLVRDYLKTRDIGMQSELCAAFSSWIAAGPQAEKLIMASPVLAELAPRSQQLVDLGTTGRQALALLEKHEAPPSGWVEARLKMIDQAEQPAGMVRFTILDPLRALVKATQQ